MKIKENRNGRFGFELTTDEERNLVLNLLFGTVITIDGREMKISETVISSASKIPSSMIEPILEHEKLSIILSKNPYLSSGTIDKLLDKNNNDICINILNSMKNNDEAVFNKVLSKLIDNSYFVLNNYNCDVYMIYNYIRNKLINQENFKRLYDCIHEIEVIKNPKYTYSIITYNYGFDDAKDYMIEYMYTNIIEEILKFEPKFFTIKSFASSNLERSCMLFEILKWIINNKNCPEYIIKELSKCKYNASAGTITIGSIASKILNERNK